MKREDGNVKGITKDWSYDSFYMLPTIKITNWEDEHFTKKSFSVDFIWLFGRITYLNLKKRNNEKEGF